MTKNEFSTPPAEVLLSLEYRLARLTVGGEALLVSAIDLKNLLSAARERDVLRADRDERMRDYADKINAICEAMEVPISCHFNGLLDTVRARHNELKNSRKVLADVTECASDKIVALQHRIAELEQCVLEQSEEFKLIRPPAEIVEQMAVYQQRIAELEALVRQLKEDRRHHMDSRLRCYPECLVCKAEKALAGKEGA